MMTTALGGLAMPVAALAQTTEATVSRSFNIPAQSLNDALTDFGQQSGLQVSVNSAEIQGISSPGVTGKLPHIQALSHLLTGTGFAFRINGNVVTLEKAPQASGDGAIQLGPVRVEGAGGQSGGGGIAPSITSDPAATEGTGSYTTRVMSTATKLPLSIRETPQSVTIITQQRIEDEGMVDLLDVINSTPGLVVILSNGVGRPTISSRGFAVDNITIDGIPQAFNSFIPSPLSNLAMYDRVEVVRGAAGLSQGAGDPAAAINMIRKKPTDAFQAAISASAGSWSDFSGTIDVSGPITQDGILSGRVVGYIKDADNFRDVEHEENKLIYATIDLNLSDNTRINLGYSYMNSFTNIVWGGIPVGPDGHHLDLPRSTFTGADWEHIKQDVHKFYVSLDHDFGGDWALKFNILRDYTDTDLLGTWVVPDDGGDTWGHVYWAGKNKTTQTGADVFLSGPVRLLGRDHELVLGAATNKQDTKRTQSFGGWSMPVTTGVDFSSWDPSSVAIPSGSVIPADAVPAELDVSQKSAYGTVRVNPAVSLKVILGARLDWYENNGTSSTIKSDGHLTKYGGIIWDFEKNHSLYASYTDIFSPQTSIDIHGDTLPPVVGQNYEIGLKGEYMGGALNLTAAIFRIDQTNLPSYLLDQSVCSTFPSRICFEASGLVRSQGVDIELQGAITPNWQIGTGYTYSHIENVATPERQYSTNRPEHLFKLNTTYTLPGSLSDWRIGGNLSYQSEVYEDISLSPGTYSNKQDAYVLTNLFVGYAPTEHLSLSARVNNVFDKTYYAALSYSVYWAAIEKFGEPRSFMLTAKYDF